MIKSGTSFLVLFYWHFRIFGYLRGSRLILSHFPSFRKWYNAPNRKKKRIYSGLVSEFGVINAGKILNSLENGITEVSLALMQLNVRPGTTDQRTFLHMFGELPYSIRFPGDEPRLIIDCGANVGYASHLFSRHYPSAKIVAIEPDGDNYRMLCDNVKLFPNVHCVKAAIWSTEENLRITNPHAASWAFRVDKADGEDVSGVKALTIDGVLRESAEKIIDILKIDIEGAERELFTQGTTAWLERTKLIFIELHDFLVPGCSAVFYKAIEGLPFRLFYDGETVIALNTRFFRY